jgi:predicted DNA-binding transcriptional regulator AlpA
MHDATQFGIRFGELSRVLRYIDGTADDVAGRVFELHKRHAQQICKAIDDAGTALIPEMRRQTLPANCLISIALGRSPKFRDLLSTGEPAGGEAPLDELVTLSQVAPLTGRAKRTLERYLKDGTLPQPDFRGGEGKSHKWYWKTLRPALSKLCNRVLPPRFPGSRII